MNDKIKWLIICIAEIVLVVSAIRYMDGFIAVCAVMMGFIIWHEYQQHIGGI